MKASFNKIDHMLPPFTLDALRVLDAIDRNKSFAAAAEELFRVPSAVSYTISKLEEELGILIFDRSKQRAVLTPAGRLILERGRHILNAAEDLSHLAQSMANGWESELKIAVDSVLGFSNIYGLIQRFQSDFPRTDIRLTEEILSGSWDALDSGRCDLVIGATGTSPLNRFATHILGEVKFAFVVAKNHPLTELPTPLNTHALRNSNMIVVADSSRYLPTWSAGLLEGRSRIIVQTIEQKIQAQCRGLGVGHLPLHRIQKELADGSLRILELEEPSPRQFISVGWRKSDKGKALKWFISQLKDMVFDNQHGLVPRTTTSNEVEEEQGG